MTVLFLLKKNSAFKQPALGPERPRSGVQALPLPGCGVWGKVLKLSDSSPQPNTLPCWDAGFFFQLHPRLGAQRLTWPHYLLFLFCKENQEPQTQASNTRSLGLTRGYLTHLRSGRYLLWKLFEIVRKRKAEGREDAGDRRRVKNRPSKQRNYLLSTLAKEMVSLQIQRPWAPPWGG